MKKLFLVLTLGIMLNGAQIQAAEQPSLATRVWENIKPKSLPLKRVLAYVAVGSAITYYGKDTTFNVLGKTTGDLASTIGTALAVQGISQCWDTKKDGSTKDVLAEVGVNLAVQSVITPLSMCAIPYMAYSRVAGIPYLGKIPLLNKIPTSLLACSAYAYLRAHKTIPQSDLVDVMVQQLALTTCCSLLSPLAKSSPRKMISGLDAAKKIGFNISVQSFFESVIKKMEATHKNDLKRVIDISERAHNPNNKKYLFGSLSSENAVITYYNCLIKWLENSSRPTKDKDITDFIKQRDSKIIQDEEGYYKCSFLTDHIKQNNDKWIEQIQEIVKEEYTLKLIAAKELYPGLKEFGWGSEETQKSAFAACPLIFQNCTPDSFASAVANIPHKTLQALKNALLDEIIDPTKK